MLPELGILGGVLFMAYHQLAKVKQAAKKLSIFPRCLYPSQEPVILHGQPGLAALLFKRALVFWFIIGRQRRLTPNHVAM